jgi:hypothetical protein
MQRECKQCKEGDCKECIDWKEKEKGHDDEIRGFECEGKFLELLKEWGRGLNLKLFHGIQIRTEKIQALCDAFGSKVPADELEKVKKGFKTLEVDVIAFNSSSICLFEVKYNISAVKNASIAVKQLQQAEEVFKLLFRIIGVTNISIKKVIAVPNKKAKETTDIKKSEKAGDYKPKEKLDQKDANRKKLGIDLMCFEEITSACALFKNIFQAENTNEEGSSGKEAAWNSDNIHSLITALVFMKCSSYYPFDGEKVFFSESKLKEDLLEGLHAQATVSKLEKHLPLEMTNHPQVQRVPAKNNDTDRFLLLKSVQKDDITCRQSPTKTEKIKVTSSNWELCEVAPVKVTEFPHCKILIILPYPNMVKDCEKKILGKGKNKTQVILIGTLEDWPIFFSRPEDDPNMVCHVFVHESIETKVIEWNSRITSGIAQRLHENPSNDLFIWLDPFQMQVFEDSNPRQVLTGPASTGKTILVQLKVLQILRRDPTTCKVLILLPFDRLVQKYKHFFLNAGVQTDGNNLLIAAPDDDQIDGFIESNSPHLFIDEYSAVIARQSQFSETLKHFLKTIPTANYQWITIDIKQSLTSTLEGNYLADEMKNKKKHLLNIHRCTSMVFDQYVHHCDINVKLGHQLAGHQNEIFTLACSSVRSYTEEVKKRIDELVEKKKYKKEDICVVFSFLDGPAKTFIFSAYLELHSMDLGISILFQCETLSQEWPVVIVCGKNWITIDQGT